MVTRDTRSCSVTSCAGSRKVPVKSVLKWASIASAPLGLTQLLLVYGINRQLGIPDTAFAFGDSLVLTVLGQLAFMPLLVLAADICREPRQTSTWQPCGS